MSVRELQINQDVTSIDECQYRNRSNDIDKKARGGNISAHLIDRFDVARYEAILKESSLSHRDIYKQTDDINIAGRYYKDKKR